MIKKSDVSQFLDVCVLGPLETGSRSISGCLRSGVLGVCVLGCPDERADRVFGNEEIDFGLRHLSGSRRETGG